MSNSIEINKTWNWDEKNCMNYVSVFENCTAAIIKIINFTNINNIIEPNNCSINFNFKKIQTLY